MGDEKPVMRTIALEPRKPESTVARDAMLGTGIAVATLLLPPGAGPIIAALLAGLGSGLGTAIWDRMRAGISQQLDEDRTTWLANVYANVDADEQGQDVREAVENRMDDPKCVRVVVESLRALADRLDPIVVPAMGALAAEYLNDRLDPDAFLRGASRMLAELSASEYEALRGLLRELAAAPEKGLLDLEFRYASGDDVGDVPVGEDEPAYCHTTVVELRRLGSTVYHSGCRLPTLVQLHGRLERVLTAYGLATSVDRSIRIEKRVACRLDRVFSLPPAPVAQLGAAPVQR